MSRTIEAVDEKGVFRPLEPISLPEGEQLQVTVPEVNAEIQRRLTALDAFEAALEDMTKEQWKKFDEAVQWCVKIL